MDVLTKVVVTYETLPGWCCSTEGARTFDDLPLQAQGYIHFIEKHLQVPGKKICDEKMGVSLTWQKHLVVLKP